MSYRTEGHVKRTPPHSSSAGQPRIRSASQGCWPSRQLPADRWWNAGPGPGWMASRLPLPYSDPRVRCNASPPLSNAGYSPPPVSSSLWSRGGCMVPPCC